MLAKLFNFFVSVFIFYTCWTVVFAGELTSSQILSQANEENSYQSDNYLDEKGKEAAFDGLWEYGVAIDSISQRHADGSGFGIGLHLGKEFYQTRGWVLGWQGHILSGSHTTSILGDDSWKSLAMYATTRPPALPALQLKAGFVAANYKKNFTSFSESGETYGIGLVTDFSHAKSVKARFHWLDYQLYKVGNDEFQSLSISVVIFFCIVGGC